MRSVVRANYRTPTPGMARTAPSVRYDPWEVKLDPRGMRSPCGHGTDAVVLVVSRVPQVRGWKALAMFPDESNRTERQFWSALAFRVSREMQNHPICTQRRLWCDGFIPEHYLLDREPRCIPESLGSG